MPSPDTLEAVLDEATNLFAKPFLGKNFEENTRQLEDQHATLVALQNRVFGTPLEVPFIAHVRKLQTDEEEALEKLQKIRGPLRLAQDFCKHRGGPDECDICGAPTSDDW